MIPTRTVGRAAALRASRAARLAPRPHPRSTPPLDDVSALGLGKRATLPGRQIDLGSRSLRRRSAPRLAFGKATAPVAHPIRDRLLALVFCLGLPAHALAQPGDVGGIYDAAATVAIASADQAAARDKALAQALHDAVQSAVVGLLGEAAAASQQAQIERAILARSRSFVTGYQVMDEGPEDGAYRVAVQAHVAVESVRRALESLDAARTAAVAKVAGPDAATDVEPSADLYLRGTVTAARYRAIRGFIERQVPGVRAVSVQSLEPGAMSLRVRGAFPARELSGYLSHADFGGFRLAVMPAEVGPDLEVVVQDAEAPG